MNGTDLNTPSEGPLGIPVSTWALMVSTIVTFLVAVIDEILAYKKGTHRSIGDMIRNVLTSTTSSQSLSQDAAELENIVETVATTKEPAEEPKTSPLSWWRASGGSLT